MTNQEKTNVDDIVDIHSDEYLNKILDECSKELDELLLSLSNVNIQP